MALFDYLRLKKLSPVRHGSPGPFELASPLKQEEAATMALFDYLRLKKLSPVRHGSPGPFELAPPPKQEEAATMADVPLRPAALSATYTSRPSSRSAGDVAPARTPTWPIQMDRQIQAPPRQRPRIITDEIFLGTPPRFVLRGDASPKTTEAAARFELFQREKSLQLLQSSHQNFVPSYKKELECKKYLLENKSSDTTVSLQLTKHYSNTESNIDSSKDDNIFAEQHKEKEKSKIDEPEIKQFSSIKTKPVDMLPKSSTIINTFSEYNVNSSNVIIPELKTYSTEKANNFTVENQNAHLDLELVEHNATSLRHKIIRKDANRTNINLESKNQSTNNLHIEKNSEEIIKRKLSFESLHENTLPAKIQKKNEINTLLDQVVTDNNIKLSNSMDHVKQKIWKNVTKCMVKKKENYQSFKQKKEQRKNRYKKNKNIREKFCEYFGSLDSSTSEREEEHEILLNYVKKKKQFDDPLHNNTPEEEDIHKGYKKLTYDASTILPKNVENINSDNSYKSTASIEKYFVMHDVTTDEEIQDRTSTDERITLINNLQENDDSDNSCDSTVSTKKYYAMHNATTDTEKEDRALTSTDSTLVNNLQKNTDRYNSDNSCEENSSSIDTENNSKIYVRTKKSKDITPLTIEMDLDENSMKDIHLDQSIEKKTTYMSVQNHQKIQETCNNKSVDLNQDTQRYTTSNLELPITFAHELLCNVNEKNSCDANNLLLANNDNIREDGKTSLLDQSLITFKKNLSEKKNESSFIQTINSPTSSNKSDCNNSHSLDNHSTDDDNGDYIEIKIKQNKNRNKNKNKLKSRVPRKFSLKATWSCIENLYTLKDNPNGLNVLFERKTSEKSKHTTSKNPENNTLLDDKQDTPAETEKIIYNSVSTFIDNASCSQQQNFQDSPILNKDKNAIEVSQRETDKYTQSVKKTPQITTENDRGSNKLACDMSHLAKQVQKASTDDKQKTNKEQNQDDILKEATSVMEHKQQVQKISTDDKRKINEEQSQSNTILEETRSVVEHNQQKEDKRTSFIEQKKTQTVTENNPGSNKTAYNMPDLREQPLQTFSDITHSKVRPTADINCHAKKFVSLDASTTSKCAYCQSTISSQSVSSRSRSQSAPGLLISPQLAFQSARPLVFSQLTPAQSTLHPSVPPQLAFPQSAPRRLVSPQLISQSAPRPSLLSQSTSTQSALIRSRSHPSTSRQSAPSIFSQLAYQARHPSVPLQTYSQLAAQSVSQQPPSSNTADNQIYSSRTNAPITSIQINASDIYKNHSNIIIPSTIKSICTYVEFCREFIRYRILRTSYTYVEFMQRMSMYVTQIKQDLEKLQALLHMKDIQNVITYVNKYKTFDQMLTWKEICNYVNLVRSYTLYSTQISQQNASPNATHNSNISESVPNTSISNVNAQPLLRNVSFPEPRMSYQNKFRQFLTMPYQIPTTSNINQQQLFDNADNYPRVSYSRQVKSNICRRRISRARGSRAYSRISNTNKEQSSKNQYTLSTNMLNIDIQQVSMSLSNASSANTNMHSYGPVNQENINMPPINNTKCARQSCTVSTKCDSSTATASVANAQQQRQYSQSSQINLNQTAHNITSSGTSTVNSDASSTDTMRNVKDGSANVNQQQANCILQVSQASSERTQFLPQNNLNSNKVVISNLIVILPTHSVQNALSNRNMQQIPQLVNEANTNMSLAITEGSNVASKNIISNTEIATRHQLQSQDTSTCAIALLINNTSQNVGQNMPNKETKILESQNKNHMQKEVPFINPQQNSTAHNILQNISNTALKTSTSQSSNISQNMISTMPLQTCNKAFILPQITETNQVIYHFNLSNFTDIQKIILHDQIQLYFQISNEMERFFNEQEYKRIHHEKTALFNLYQDLHNYTEKYVKDNSQNKSQSQSLLQENTIRTPVDKSTKTQSDQDNKNSLVHNSDLEKQSIDSDISKNSKLTAPKNNLKAQNEDFAITEKSLPKNTLIKKYKYTEVTQTTREETGKTISKFFLIHQEDHTNEWSDNSSDGTSESSLKLYIDENPEQSQRQEQCDKISSSEGENSNASQASASRLLNAKYKSTKITQIHTADEEHIETMSEHCLNAQQEDSTNKCNSSDGMFESSSKLCSDKKSEKSQKNEHENAQQEEFANDRDNDSTDKTSESPEKVHVDESIKNTEVILSSSKNISDANFTDISQEFLTEAQDAEITEEENSRQSLVNMEEMYLPEMSLKFEVSEEASNTEESITQLLYLLENSDDIKELLEDIEKEKLIIDTHNNINATNDHRKEEEKVSIENNDNSEVTEIILPRILNVRSISPSLFEKLDNINTFSQNELEMLSKNDRRSLNINNDLEISDEYDKPCLRCKRKSMVCCQDCLKAYYCSRRCSSLHWNAEHHKNCKG
ncbi:uncharacterized protein LOC114255637 [Monomorium pharaonis]|uniref:uncharacterized protein LOC114255637 n=1 Tax=Monomorium pharaonis TaxID=307658 RepID=UPI00174637E5|nr:uncharacterized protein LOC114255637 [Monomorium pharaonis]